ncbi:MAG: transposase family protein [Porphyromonadaceae bacterium]|nr:MAG: transposase family protein [Porphyromonadaceae bacterium]
MHTIRLQKVVNKFGSRGSILYRLKEFSSSIPDFRRSGKGNIRHRLDDIIILIILGRASGCIGRAQIMEFGRYNLDKFRKMGMLRNGVPSEATLCRVDNGIDDLAMADRMQRFVEVFHGELLKKTIAARR